MNFETTEEARAREHREADAKGELWACYIQTRHLPYKLRVNPLSFHLYQGPADPTHIHVLRNTHTESPIAGPIMYVGKPGDVTKKVIDTFGTTNFSFGFYYDESRPR